MFCSKCGSKLEDGSKFCHNCGNQLSFVKEVEKVTKNDVEGKKQNNKKIGLFWLIAPSVFLIIILVVWGVMSFVFESIGISESPNVTQNIIQVILGFLGIVDVIAIIAGIPLGIIYLNKESLSAAEADPRSGRGVESVFPEELNHWSWGAAGLSWIWGAANRVWISFLMFIPLVNIVFWIFLGIYGNKWAWQKNYWRSVEDFKKSQDKWKVWGIIFFVLSILSVIGSLISSGNNS